jgi:hypothetical protein
MTQGANDGEKAVGSAAAFARVEHEILLDTAACLGYLHGARQFGLLIGTHRLQHA